MRFLRRGNRRWLVDFGLIFGAFRLIRGWGFVMELAPAIRVAQKILWLGAQKAQNGGAFLWREMWISLRQRRQLTHAGA
jgi:hypothetical protein